MKILFKIIIGLVLTAQCVMGQQDPTFTLYNYNMNVINPAYAGTVEASQLTANFRSQWVGIQDAPEIQSFSFASRLGEKVGIGASVVNSTVFVLNETDIYLDFSYRLQISRYTNLYLGLKAGGSSVNIDLNRVGENNDPLFTENVNRFNPNVGIGAYLKGEHYFIGVSAPTLLKGERYEKESGVVTNATNELHLFANAGYTFFTNRDIQFTPSFMARFVQGVPFSLDLTGTIDLYEKVELGISHRLEESISAVSFFKIAPWAAFGYAYEHALTDVGDYSTGTHEIMMRFRW